MTAALNAKSISVRYGGVQALVEVDIDIEPGKIVGLIGANGAGKTSLIDALTGFTACAGAVRLGGREIDSWRPHRRARAGLRRTWQSAELFDELSVRENVAVAAGRPRFSDFVREGVLGRPGDHVAADAALEALGIQDLAASDPDQLTEGQRKLVDVARALATNPEVICLDEPAAGLDRDERATLGAHLRNICRADIGLLLVDHDMDLVLEVSDWVVVLDFGKVIARGTPADVRSAPSVIEAYLGVDTTRLEPGAALMREAQPG